MSVVVVMTDDQELGTIDAQAMPYLFSQPHGDWSIFPRAVMSTPLCGVARAGLFTGQRWDHHGVKGNNDAYTNLPKTHTFAVWAQAAGFRTGLFGKSTNNASTTVPLPGWDVYRAQTQATKYRDFTLLHEDGTTTAHGPTEYVTDVTAQQCADFIAGTPAGQDFVLYWAPNAPHGPAEPADRHVGVSMPTVDPPTWNQADLSGHPAWLRAQPLMSSSDQGSVRGHRENARRTLLALDEGLKKIDDALVAAGRIGSTQFAFLTDNGQAYGRKRITEADRTIAKRAPYPYSRSASLRVRWPGKGAQTINRLVTHLDVTATIVELTGATPTRTLDGRSLAPLIDNPNGPWRPAVEFTHHGNGETAIPEWWAVLADDGRLYVEWSDAESWRELYDETTDPHDTVNLHTTTASAPYASTLATLKADPHGLADTVPAGAGSRRGLAGAVSRKANVGGVATAVTRHYAP